MSEWLAFGEIVAALWAVLFALYLFMRWRGGMTL